ncbi:dehydrogenase reductase sdr family member 4 [Stylonychia lemnae]|uniref:Dehydrogenase reductase sdr family member 4 n=1 Tax=Stylonychia lemnae TaxID=5949 RepID=A0A077ZW55_STYLE|nr:dehydrogenase reductase sdr family member 4 [Stylonychia lemnae]|eukprot:CDW74099.1 dehydrogenase reductase sdr family member 4 [Stylonychia lemnae]
MNRYKDKVCLVTASTQGIGFAIAKRMAEEGAFVYICSRKEKNVKEALDKLKGLKVEGYPCHIGLKEQRLALLKKIEEKHGRLDVLVCNQAASTHFGSQMDISEGSFDKMWDLNVKSIFYLIKESKELLKKGGKQSNVLVVSSVGGKGPNYTIGVYNMTKAALDNMVVWLAQELIPDDIRLNAISPGLIKTEFSGPLWKDNQGVPAKSLGESDQIASVAATMCSDDGSFVNGENYAVHGGFPKL